LLLKPVNTPVPLANGEAMSAFAPLAAISGPDPTVGGLPTSFIRISMLNPGFANPPHVELRAGNLAAGTTGAPQSIDPSLVSPPGKGLADGSNATDAASAYWSPPYANNVFLLKVVIDIPGTSLAVRITNDTGAARDFVWVIGDSDVNSQQPWMQLTPAALSFTALINQTDTQTAQPVQITNRGTGQLAVPTAVTPAIAAPYTVSGLPATILPNPATPATVTIGFKAPATIGDTAAAPHTFGGDPGAVPASAGHNDQLTLSASTGKLEIAMVLDGSGSMLTAPDGSDGQR